MYTAKTTVDRIQLLIKEKGFTQKQVFTECGIDENTVKRMTDKKGISSFYLAKIADYLDCSVDYLLGRTDIPNVYNQSNNSGTIQNGGNGFQASHNGVVNISSSSEPDKLTARFMQRFEELSYEEQFKVMAFVESLKKNQQK